HTMKITRHGNNLWQLTRLVAFNCFLVREDDGLTLVDTGLGNSDKAILHAAETIDLPITRITLTHAHGDHIGALDTVAAQLAQAEIAFTRRTASFLQGDRALLPSEPQTPLRGSFQTRTTQPTRFLAPGDQFGSLHILAAPGHSPDQIAFLDERDGTLIAGDAFQTAAGIAVAGMRRWLFPFPAMATWHLPTALESARALRARQPTRLAVGHGPLLESPLPQMDAAIAAAEEHLNGQA
ncbi:MAG: MBL fold metallo-hydrolase, partial [Anaerolineae bacterium]|nr:MBL fold metallo-hydrolase [Anaerolineae bacterium]